MATIAIPILALGSLYIMSQEDKENKNCNKEGFQNMGKPKNSLPGVVPQTPDTNYPITLDVGKDNVRAYKNPNQTTDKFFGNNVYLNTVAENPPGSVGSGREQTMSLTGEPIDKSKFEHNNMVPFFGAKIKGSTGKADIHESILDNMQGAGSHLINKQECAPLFKPDHNLNYINGAPNMSDFYQSRVNPGKRIANVKPWQEEKIAPGLNKGFNGCGGAGFNSGMESRDSWLPKTVNELRTDTNPKMTFGLTGHEGPANSTIKSGSNTKTQGNVEKYLPDTYYTVGPSRWFTTTGLEKGQTSRGVEVLHHVNRTTTSCPYFGSGGGPSDSMYVKGEYEETHRHQLPTNPISNADAHGQNTASNSDYGANSYTNYANNRSTTRVEEPFGIVQGAMKAITAPILDILRPSRKENAIGSGRPYGNAGTTVTHLPVYNPADRLKTTIKETTEGKLDNNHLNINNQTDMGAGGYLVNKQIPVDVQRDTTNVQNIGNAAPLHAGNRLYNAAYNQRNNPNKTYPIHPNQGGMQIFNQEDNIQISKVDNDRNNNRMWAPQTTVTAIPSTDTYGKINVPQYYDQGQSCKRIEPDILSAFKKNPYAQSLQSWI